MPHIRSGYNSFQKRLRSFSRVNLKPRFAKLAAAGFWYYPTRNLVQCHYCNAHAYSFLSHRDPNIFHAKTSPDCMFLRRKFGDLWINNAINNFSRDYEDESFLCKICCVRKIFCIFKPCGHAMCCDVCFFSIENCPYCTADIHSYQRLYY